VGGELAQAGVFAGADGVFDPGVDPVGGVDVGGAGAPAAQAGRQVGDPQAVAPAVFGLEQGELGAGVGPLAAGEDAHRRWPVVKLVPGGAFAQQPGQLGDMGFLDPAAAVGAATVRAGVLGAALADLAAGDRSRSARPAAGPG